MPITVERTGVFPSQRDNTWRWYVVDPAGGHDPDEAASEWRSRYADTNSPKLRRVVAAVCCWAIFLVVFIGPPAVVSILAQGMPFLELVMVLILIAGFGGGIALALTVYGHIIPQAHLEGRPPRYVAELEPEVLGWAEPTTPLVDIWELNRSLQRMLQLQTAFLYWGFEYDFEEEVRPDRVIEDVVEPVLRHQFEVERVQLRANAQRLGFPLPERADRDPESLSNYSEH